MLRRFFPMTFRVSPIVLVSGFLSNGCWGRYLKTEILIVDDNEVVRCMMTKILGASGYKVTAVGDGQEAVDELSCRQPDLVLSDIQMPRLDGCEVCRWMKSREETRNIPIVLLSGLADT